MKLTSLLTMLLAIILSPPAQAENTDKELLKRFAKSIGVYQQIEEVKASLQHQSAQNAEQFAQQLFASKPGLPAQFKADVQEEILVFASNIAGTFDIEVAANSYIRLISDKLSDSEIEELTVFFESRLGRKFTQSNIE